MLICKRYKGFFGKIEFDVDTGIFRGEVLDTPDVITFQGRTGDEVKKAYRKSIDDYLAFCNERGEDPNKPFSGQLITRISPALHRQISAAAVFSGKSLNAWVVEQLQAAAIRDTAMKKAPKATVKDKRKSKKSRLARRTSKHVK